MNKYIELIKNALEEKKAEDIQIIDISEISSIADYFIITNGSNLNQVQAISDRVCEVLAQAGLSIRATEGYQTGSWILLDYGDIIIHIFDRESREFYNLERMWKDGKVINL